MPKSENMPEQLEQMRETMRETIRANESNLKEMKAVLANLEKLAQDARNKKPGGDPLNGAPTPSKLQT